MATEPFTVWTDLAADRAQLLPDDLPRGFRPDDLPAALERLEAIVLDRIGDQAALLRDGDGEFVLGVAAYLGEELIRVGRGTWIPDPDGDVAAVRADPATGLPDVSPFRLIAEAVERRDGRRFVTVYERWAVGGPVAEAPRRPTRISRWLTARAAAFDGWVATYGPEGGWDLSPESIDRVEALLRRLTPSQEQLWLDTNQDLREGAAWYLGEVIRHGLGGHWASGSQHNHLFEVGPFRAAAVPVVILERALGRPGFTRFRYDQLAGTGPALRTPGA
jgi:hypothetical protein